MVNGIRASDLHGLNKGCGLRFCVGSQVQQETPEESQRTYWPKRYEYNYKDEDNSLKTLTDKVQALSQKFRHLIYIYMCVCVYIYICFEKNLIP